VVTHENRKIRLTAYGFLIVAILSVGMSQVAATAEPQALLPDVAQTEAAFERYESLSVASAWSQFSDGPSLKPGALDARVPSLRARLRATDDYIQAPEASGRVYDLALEQAVRRFQARHGLIVDGIVGRRTRAALNVSAARRAAMLRLNLRRIRGLLPWPERFVLVQAPAFEAAAVDRGRAVLRSRAIVGRATRQTPELRSEIKQVVFNPFWTVPIKIARRDIAPKVQKNPAYLTEQGIRVFGSWTADAPEIDPASVEWSALPTTIKLRQDPGPKNALGQVKFLFPNSYDVYLHDTPNHDLFERLPRAFSSGCVRLERALDLAAWLLADEPRWSDDLVHETATRGKRKAVRLQTPVPVIFTYLTAWAGRDGVVQFRNDLYGRDRVDEAPDSLSGPDGCHVDDPALQS